MRLPRPRLLLLLAPLLVSGCAGHGSSFDEYNRSRAEARSQKHPISAVFRLIAIPFALLDRGEDEESEASAPRAPGC